MRTLNKGMAARYQQENHVTRYPVILYRSVVLRDYELWSLAKLNLEMTSSGTTGICQEMRTH